MYELFKSIIETDRAAVVVCDVNHTIVYMNNAAKKTYRKDLTGCSLLNCHNEKSNEIIIKIVDWFKKSAESNMIYTYKNVKQNKDVYMVALRDDGGNLIGYYEKHEYRNPETAAMYDFSKSII